MSVTLIVIEKMGQYDDEVKGVIGRGPYDAILEAVTNGHIDSQKMEDIARLLDPKIRGSHKKRDGCCEAEMRRMLSEWWNLELYNLSTESALEKLVRIFNDETVNMRPLANKIKKSIPKSPNPKPRRHSSGKSKRGSYQREVSASEIMDKMKDQRDTLLAEFKEARNNHDNHLKDKVEIIEAAHKKEIENLHMTYQVVQKSLQISEAKGNDQRKRIEDELNVIRKENKELETCLISLDETFVQEKKDLEKSLKEGFRKQERELKEKHANEMRELKEKHKDDSRMMKKAQDEKVKEFEEKLKVKAKELAKQIATCDKTKKWGSVAVTVGFIFGVTIGVALASRSENIRSLSAASQRLFTEALSSSFQQINMSVMRRLSK